MDTLVVAGTIHIKELFLLITNTYLTFHVISDISWADVILLSKTKGHASYTQLQNYLNLSAVIELSSLVLNIKIFWTVSATLSLY
jgi:hypothetical protein